MGKTILEATVVDIEKRRYPSKHYVYVIEVTWSEGTKTVIYRRYSNFFEFQCGLLERFPIHAGAKNPADRCIPFLPGKKIFGRSHIRSVAQKRMGPISDYCKAVIRLPQEISEDSYILNFFEVTQEDINPPTKKAKVKKDDTANEISDPILLEQYTAIADYKKQKNMECSLTAGQVVEVIDKNENGWWFVHMDDLNEGWVPATYLEPIYGQNEATKPIVLEDGEEEIYITTSSYTSKHNDELTFERGVLMEVFQKGMDGWWKARYLGKEGYVPACYLNRYYGTVTNDLSGATQVVSTLKEAVNTTLQSSASKTFSKPHITLKPGVDPYADEPIYAPTPRKESIKISHPKRTPAAVLALKNNLLTTPTKKSSFEDYETPEVVSKVNDNDDDSEEDVFHDYETLSEHYVTVAEFQANVHDGLSFQAGIEVSVITKNPSGWWYVEMGKTEGWVPSSYLEKVYRPLDHIAKHQSHSAVEQFPAKHEKLAKVESITSTKSTKDKKDDSESIHPAIKLKSPKPLERKGNIPITPPKPAQKPSLPKKPIKKEEKTSSVGALAAVLSKGEEPVIKISQPSSVASNKSLMSHKLPAKSSNTDTLIVSHDSVKRSSSSDSVRELKKTDETRKAKSPPPIRPRPAEFIPVPKPRKVSPSNSSMGMKYLRKSTENLVDIEPTSTPPTRRSTNVPSRPSNSPKTQRSTTSSPKLATNDKLPLEKASPKKPSPPSRNNQSFSTQTIKLGELEHALKSKKPVAANKRSASVTSSKQVPPAKPAQTKKTPPPRPSNSPAQSRKGTYVTIADFIGNDEGSLSFKEGATVDVLEKTEEGWWYVSIKGNEGWVPSTFIEKTSNKPDRPKPPKPSHNKKPPPIQPVKTLNSYRAISDYSTPVYEDSGIDLVAGELYEVLEKTSGGWWFVQHGAEEGWAPSSFLEPA